MKSLFALATALISVCFVAETHATLTWDLATDWSDSINPNGAWSYNGVDGLPLAVHRSDWDSQTRVEHFSSAQPAWSAQDLSRSVPMAFKSLGVTGGTIWNLDAPSGKVGMHGQPEFAGVTWTSPIDGPVEVSGGVWRMRKNNTRVIEWRLTLNGSILKSGILSDADPYTSSNPYNLADGTGPSLLTFGVNQGDVIGLIAGWDEPPFHSDFVGVNLAITAIPEPSSIAMCCLAFVGFIVLRRPCSWSAAPFDLIF